MARSDYKYRLARSTLALIPLLGIHYFMFLFVEPEPGGSENAGIYIKLAFEMVFTSFQVSEHVDDDVITGVTSQGAMVTTLVVTSLTTIAIINGI